MTKTIFSTVNSKVVSSRFSWSARTYVQSLNNDENYAIASPYFCSNIVHLIYFGLLVIWIKFWISYADRWYKDMACAYQNQSSAYGSVVRQLFASCSPAVLCDADLNQSEWRILFRITRLTHVHVLWKCFVCPQNVNLPISIWLYSTKITRFENEIDPGHLRIWEQQFVAWSLPLVNDRFCSWSQAIRTSYRPWSRPIACDHAQNRSLTSGKDQAANCYSLII